MDTFQSVASRIGGLQERSDDDGTRGIMGSKLKTVSSPFHRVGDLDRTAPSCLFLPGSRRTQPYLTFVGDQRQAAAFNCAQIPDTFQAQVNAFTANTRIQCENFLDFGAKCIESDVDSGINFSKIQTVEDFWGVAIAKSGDITRFPRLSRYPWGLPCRRESFLAGARIAFLSWPASDNGVRPAGSRLPFL